MIRVCKKCGVEKELTEFVRDNKCHFGRAHTCKMCAAAYKLAHKGDMRKEIDRKVHLKSRYGLTVEQWEEMFEQQHGRCAICGTHQSDLVRVLGVDHNDDTGQIRELLCSRCNSAIGLLDHDIQRLMIAAEYLRKWQDEFDTVIRVNDARMHGEVE